MNHSFKIWIIEVESVLLYYPTIFNLVTLHIFPVF